MRPEATDGQCRKLLTERVRQFHGGGVGLLIDSVGPEWRPRRKRRSWGVSVALTAVLLVLCTAGGFASGAMWDGQDSWSLSVGLAEEAMLEHAAADTRRVAMGNVDNEVRRLIGVLMAGLEDEDPGVRADAKATLANLRILFPTSEGFDGLVQLASDFEGSGPDVERAMTGLNARVFRAIRVLTKHVTDRETGDPMRVRAEQFLRAMAKHAAKPLNPPE